MLLKLLSKILHFAVSECSFNFNTCKNKKKNFLNIHHRIDPTLLVRFYLKNHFFLSQKASMLCHEKFLVYNIIGR